MIETETVSYFAIPWSDVMQSITQEDQNVSVTRLGDSYLIVMADGRACVYVETAE